MFLDKFYTNKDIAQRCINNMLLVVPPNAYFIEPSAGCGNFLFEHTQLAIDLAPEHCCIQQGDFFELGCEQANICFYGNPPFGKRNSLTKDFIRHAIEGFCGTKWVAFVLPKSFKKHTHQKVFGPDWRLVFTEDLPNKSFTQDGKPFSIPCVFQIWEKDSCREDLRAKGRESFSNEHFSISSKIGDYFIMGSAPHTLKLPGDVKPTNRGYWLNSNLCFNDLSSNLKEVNWKAYSGASGGVAWWNKTDIINQYEEHFKIGAFSE